MFKKFSTAVCGLGVILMTAGVVSAQTTTQTAKAKTEHTAKKTGNVLSDAEITTAVKTKLLADKVVGGLKLDVDTDHGVVTLSGPVSSAAERAQALRLARNTKGVTRVVSKLTVGKTEPTTGRVPAADTTTTKADTTTKKDETKIIIKDDTTPAIKKGAEKTKEVAKDVAGKTADVAKDVAGKTSSAAKKTADKVKDTKVEVKDDAGVGDTSVTSAVKTRLMTDDVARATSIEVHTNSGVVTISGTVPTAADKARIGQLVEKTTGVKRVVNNLSVK